MMLQNCKPKEAVDEIWRRFWASQSGKRLIAQTNEVFAALKFTKRKPRK